MLYYDTSNKLLKLWRKLECTCGIQICVYSNNKTNKAQKTNNNKALLHKIIRTGTLLPFESEVFGFLRSSHLVRFDFPIGY